MASLSPACLSPRGLSTHRFLPAHGARAVSAMTRGEMPPQGGLGCRAWLPLCPLQDSSAETKRCRLPMNSPAPPSRWGLCVSGATCPCVMSWALNRAKLWLTEMHLHLQQPTLTRQSRARRSGPGWLRAPCTAGTVGRTGSALASPHLSLPSPAQSPELANPGATAGYSMQQLGAVAGGRDTGPRV